MHSTATASCSRRAPQSCTKSLSKFARTSPDILLVSGDLTKDGEQECHAALAKQLQQLQQMPAMLHAVRLDITRYELLDGALRSEGYAARQVLDLG